MADRAGEERGAVLVLTALLMTGLLTMAAIVTDLGLQRAMLRSNQALADLAALAAGPGLGDSAGPDGRAACQDVVRYLRLNREELTGLQLDCPTLPDPCDSASTQPGTVSATVGSYAISITYPVSDALITDPLVGGVRTEDGEACERLRVEVQRTESAIFGAVAGRDEIRTTSSAVVRQVSAKDRRVPSLWLLDPHGCTALSVQGGSRVTVGEATRAGVISSDSDGSACGGNSFTVDVGGSGSFIKAIPDGLDLPATIGLYAMSAGQKTCSTGNPRACDPTDVAGGLLYPQPTRQSTRATRAPIDHAYNCKTGYPDFAGIPVADCEDTTQPYIDQLRAAVGTSGTPVGFQRWSTSHGCNVAAGVTTVAGNWVVDCQTLRIGNGTDVIFSGGNVIFNGSISMTGGTLQLNTANPQALLPSACRTTVTSCLTQSSAGAAWAYMRSGDLVLTGGALVANRTMIYQHAGDFRMSGGSPPRWSAPSEGPFQGLSVWSEKVSSGFQINGGASMELDGVFFTPNANAFTLNGGSPLLPQSAQFIAYRATIAGGAVLTLSPNSNHGISIPAPPITLIR